MSSSLLEKHQVTVEEINALPEKLRRYVHDIETICDPAGMVQEIAALKDQNAQLLAERRRLLLYTRIKLGKIFEAAADHWHRVWKEAARSGTHWRSAEAWAKMEAYSIAGRIGHAVMGRKRREIK